MGTVEATTRAGCLSVTPSRDTAPGGSYPPAACLLQPMGFPAAARLGLPDRPLHSAVYSPKGPDLILTDPGLSLLLSRQTPSSGIAPPITTADP